MVMTTVLVAGDKLSGSFAQDAFGIFGAAASNLYPACAVGYIQNLALPAMVTTPGTSWWTAFITPNIAGSLAEVCKRLSKAQIARALNETSGWLSMNYAVVVGVAVPFVLVTHIIMARLVLRSKQGGSSDLKQQ